MLPLELQRRLLDLADIALVEYGQADLAGSLRRLADQGMSHTCGTLSEWLQGEGIGTPALHPHPGDVIPSTLPKRVRRDRFGVPIREEVTP